MVYNIKVGYAYRAAEKAGLAECAEGFSAADEASEISGDTVFSCWLPDGSRAVILSDGMGHGRKAAAESRAAAGLLRRLLKQGISSAQAIREVNRYLVQKGRMEEIYATVDLTIIGQSDGRAKFYKLGAAPSYIIRGRRIRKISQAALPVGILPEIRLTHVSARLSAGDIIVMMSDGICDSGWRCPESDGCDSGWRCPEGGSESEWVESFLGDMINGNGNILPGVRQMAELLLAEARSRSRDSEMDDATVAVIQIR